MSIRKYLMLLTLSLGGVSALLAQPPTPTPPARQFNFPPVGLAFGETMQVNLFNQAANSSNGTAASCTGTVSFFDATGTEVPKSGGNFTVAAGDTQSITLLGTAVDTSTGMRAEIRAVVSLTVAKGTPCSLVPSLEIFDSTSGATHAYLNGNAAGGPVPALGFGRD